MGTPHHADIAAQREQAERIGNACFFGLVGKELGTHPHRKFLDTHMKETGKEIMP